MPKGRPRFANGHAYTPARTRAAEKDVQTCWMYAGRPRAEGWFTVDVKCVFPRPKRQQHPYPPRPDADNLAKLVMDALNTHAFDDDSRCHSLTVTKEYGDDPRTVIVIDDGV